MRDDKEKCSSLYGEGWGHIVTTARGMRGCTEPAFMRKAAEKKEFKVWRHPRLDLNEFLITSEGFFYGAKLWIKAGILCGAVWNSKEFVGLEYTWSDPGFSSWKPVTVKCVSRMFECIQFIKSRIDDQSKWEYRKANAMVCKCWWLPVNTKFELKRIGR